MFFRITWEYTFQCIYFCFTEINHPVLRTPSWVPSLNYRQCLDNGLNVLTLYNRGRHYCIICICFDTNKEQRQGVLRCLVCRIKQAYLISIALQELLLPLSLMTEQQSFAWLSGWHGNVIIIFCNTGGWTAEGHECLHSILESKNDPVDFIWSSCQYSLLNSPDQFLNAILSTLCGIYHS